jgi:hypothetical protein
MCICWCVTEIDLKDKDSGQQAKLSNNYKNIRLKLLKNNLTLYVTTSTSTAGLNWTPYDPHTTHDTLPQQQINITK